MIRSLVSWFFSSFGRLLPDDFYLLYLVLGCVLFLFVIIREVKNA